MSLAIGILAGAAAAIPLYLITRPEQATESPAVRAASTATDTDARELYCAQRTSPNGVIVSTGAGCARNGESASPDSPTVTVTREPGALIITASDP